MKRRCACAAIAFPILILFIGISCSWAGNASAPGSIGLKPQAGAWKAALDIRREEGNDEHWGLNFIVSNDGKQITQAQGAHYYGELTADTQVSVDMDINIPEKIINNSFTLSFKELRGFSISTYSFEGTFLSAVEAKGTVKIGGTIYPWTASPATTSGTSGGSATTTGIPVDPYETPSSTPAPTPTFSPLTGAAAIAAGVNHTCILNSYGGVQCWGSNGVGQLGDGTVKDNSTPVFVNGLPGGISAIAAGGEQTCALTSNAGLKCWGDNGSGQLGDGTGIDSRIPVDVFGLTSGIKAVVTGRDHACALTTSGGVKCWGHNDKGQLGDGTTTDSLVPDGHPTN